MIVLDKFRGGRELVHGRELVNHHYDIQPRHYLVVGGKPVTGFCLFLAKITKFAKNIWEPVIENVTILDHLMADTSSKRQKIYIF